MTLDIFTPQGPFGTNSARFTICNAYARPLPPFPHSVSPDASHLELLHPYLVAGEFNIHNTATDPFRLLSWKEESESAPYFDPASDLGLTLVNTRGVYPWFTPSGAHRPSTIDLLSVNVHMTAAFRSWDASSLPSTGSDHAPILITISPPHPPQRQTQTTLARSRLAKP